VAATADGGDEPSNAEHERDQPDQADPPAGHYHQAQRGRRRDRDEGSHAGVLAGPDLPRLRPPGRTCGQEQHRQHDQVVDVRSREDADGRRDGSEEVTHSRPA
jgi:hypothetical protein